MAKIDIHNCNPKKCSSCIFGEKPLQLSPGRIDEIKEYLVQGRNHICHQTERICRGGRDFQLNIFHKMKIIEAPTDEALYEANDKYMKNE